MTERSRPKLNTTPEPREGFTAVGLVLRPHGLRGEIRVLPFSPNARNIQRGRPVYAGGQRRIVLRARPDRDAWILALEGLTDRATAERLRSTLIETPDAEVLRDDSDSYFVHELIGLRVVTIDGHDVGILRDVMTTGSNDVWIAQQGEREVLIPAIAEVIDRVDLDQGVVVITPLRGMLDEST